MGQLVRVAAGSINDRQGCAWKASGLIAVTDITGRLCHKGTVRGKKSTCGHWCLWRCGVICTSAQLNSYPHTRTIKLLPAQAHH